MDVTESQLTIALQEAFTCYLAFLSHTQKLRESKFPRQGKGVETIADLSTQQWFQSRVAGIEACLQYTRKIARRVGTWVNYPPEEGSDKGITVETEVVSFETFSPDGQEVPYLDFFSGCLIQPITPFSAGPSNSNDGATSKEIDGQGNCQSESPPRPQVGDEDEDEDKDDVLDIRGRRPDVNIASRTSLGIHPNAPISVTSKSPDQFYSAPSSIAPSINQRTPDSSSPSANETENENESYDEESEEEDESSEEDDLARDSDSDESQDDESDESEDEDDTVSITSKVATAFYLRKNRDIDDAEYAQRIHTAEAKQAEEVDRDLAQAKRLADQWAREEEARLIRQKKYAEDLGRKEKEGQERIKKDREAALKAQKEQEQWELEAIARETAAMRAEERKRRAEAEAKRVAEQERRLKIEREKRWAEEIKQRNAALAEEKKKRDAEEAQRRQREREKREKTITIDCLACMEPTERKDMVILPCRHVYCGECIKFAFKSAYKGRTPFKCCSSTISPKLTPLQTLFSPSFTQKYTLLLLELSTPHPKYCSLPTCSRFLPPNLYHLPSITCQKCKTRTCSACGQEEHAGVCREDREGRRVEKLARRKGWKQCPECSIVVERTEGCLHITCRCGAEWCYACLREWGVCGSSCGRGAGMDDDFGVGRREGGANGAARVIPVIATAVLMAAMRSR